MHFYSYDMRDPVFLLAGWALSVQIITLENIYGLAPDALSVQETESGGVLECGALRFAGGQERAEGRVRVTAKRETERLTFRVNAAMRQKIKCIKLLLRRLPDGCYYDLSGKPEPFPREGRVCKYPLWMRLPLLGMRFSGASGVWGVSARRERVGTYRFALYSEEQLWSGPDGFVLELIHEQDADRLDCRMQSCDWVLRPAADWDGCVEEYLRFAERRLGLTPWEQRTDVPAWLRDIRLCVTLHGMHWSGYRFLCYREMQDILEYVAGQILPCRVLVFLPGWEGRYYWQYGDYRPEPRLGGEAAFAELFRFARERGFHLMPMFGGNCCNMTFAECARFGADAYLKSPLRNRYHGNGPDWNQDRGQDTGWQAWLNPGHPAWRRELCRQILALKETYGFDAVYLDTIYAWENDPDHSVADGIRAVRDRLREAGLMVAAEDWFDALLGQFPLFLNDWDPEAVALPKWFGRYARYIAFIGHAEPSRGSGGVQHGRCFPYRQPLDDAAYLPTLSFVNGTLEQAEAEICRVIASAAR